MVSADEARRELARRELERRRGTAAPDERDSFLGKVDSVVRGAADTLSLGFADEIAAGLGTGFGMLGDYDAELNRQRGIDQSDAENRFGYRLGGQLAGAVAGGAGLGAAGVLPSVNAARAGAGLGRTAMLSGAEGAAMGAAQGFGGGEGVEGRLEGAKTGALWGAGLGAAIPVATQVASEAARRAITPFASSPERQVAVRALEAEGVPLTAGQRTGSVRLRRAEGEIGGSRAGQIMEDQGRAFTDAAMRRAGGSGLADPDNLTALRGNLSQGFEDISSRNALRADQTLVDDILQTGREYRKVLTAERRQMFDDLAYDIAERIKGNGGTLPGKDYQTIRSRLTKRAQNARGSDNELADAYRGLRDALDSAMDRSIQPGDVGRWGELRRQYGNYKTIERAAAGAGENAAMGVISPAQLRMASAAGKNRGAYARGEGDMAPLARAGQAIMTPLPDSGTAGRLSARNLGTGLFSLVGAGAGGAAGGAETAIAGMLLGAAAPGAAGKAMMSPLMQRYLSNQAVTQLSPEARAIANAILNYGQASEAGREPLRLTVRPGG